MLSLAVQCEVGKHFADDRGKLETVTAETTGDRDAVEVRMAIDDEMAVGGIRVHADSDVGERAVGIGQVVGERVAEVGFVGGFDGAVDGGGIGRLIVPVVGDLETAVRADGRNDGEAVVRRAVGQRNRERWENVRREPRGIDGVDPTEDLPGHCQWNAKAGSCVF